MVLLRAPQAPALPQLMDQVTPALVESLLTVAVSVAVELARSDAGAPVSITEMGGGVVAVVPLPPPPHARSAPIAPKTINRNINWRHFIECSRVAMTGTRPNVQSKAPSAF